MKSQLLLVAAVLCLHVEAVSQKPLIEPSTTKPSTTLTKEELEKIPSDRKLADILKAVPEPPSGSSVTSLVPTPLGNAEGFNTSVTTPPGLHTITIKSPGGDKLEIYLPNRVLAGHSFTGSMNVIPATGNSPNVMDGYSVNINGQNVGVDQAYFTVVPASNKFQIALRDKKGKQLGAVDVPLLPSNYSLPSPDFPSSGTAGNLLVINCACDGRLPLDSYFNLGGKPMRILTSTPGTIVVLNNYGVPPVSLTLIQTSEV